MSRMRFLLSRLQPASRRSALAAWQAFFVAVAFSHPAFAQLPTTQLTSIFPAGGKLGTTVEVTIAGADLDDCSQLKFNHSGIAAEAKMIAATALEPARPIPNQFMVKIAADVPPGIYEARALGRFGLSNPRAFVVGAVDEVSDASGNASADKALDVPIPATVNGHVDANSYEFLRLDLKKGERVLIDVAARRIDARLDATVVLLDPSGRELKKVKEGVGADPVIDFTAPADGKFLLKLYDEIYGGGNDYFYRLTASRAPFIDFVFPPAGPPGSTNQYTLYGRNLPGGKPVDGLTSRGAPLEKLPVNISLPADEKTSTRLALSGFSPLTRVWQDGIEYRLPTPAGAANPVTVYYAKAPTVVIEQEPNNGARQAQRIAVPCEVAGQFYPERDMDWYEFEAKKGQTLWIEAISHQLGLPSDPFFAIYRVKTDEKGKEQQTEVAQVDDVQDRAGRRNPAADEFDVSNDDPAYKFVAPEDGLYRILVRDQFGDSRQDPSFVYRLVIREPQPDFRLVAYPTSPPATQQQQLQTALATASVRRGGTVALALIVQRRDEFDGEIAVSVEGLPPGVSCPGAVLGGSVTEGSLVFIAADDAPAWAGPIRIIAKSKIGDRELTREARYGVVVWGTPNRQQQPSEFRLAPGISLGVIDKEMEPALVRIGEERVYDTWLGANLEIPITIARREDFQDPVKLTPVGLSQQMRPKDVTFDGDKKEAKFELTLNPQNVKPGSYTFYMKGETKRKYSRNPEAVAAAEAEQKRVADMIKAINDEIKSATEAKNEAALKAAQDKLKAATDLKTQCEKRLDDVKKASQPKDVPIALISTPIRLRVFSAPLKLSLDPPAASVRPGGKQDLSVKVERLVGFADTVELSLEPPAGVQGLAAEKITLKKDQADGKLQIVVADNATPGSHACTLLARARSTSVLGGVKMPFASNSTAEVKTPLTITIEKQPAEKQSAEKQPGQN